MGCFILPITPQSIEFVSLSLVSSKSPFSGGNISFARSAGFQIISLLLIVLIQPTYSATTLITGSINAQPSTVPSGASFGLIWRTNGTTSRYFYATVRSESGSYTVTGTKMDTTSSGLLGLGLFSTFSSSNPFTKNFFALDPNSYFFPQSGKIYQYDLAMDTSSDTISFAGSISVSGMTLVNCGQSIFTSSKIAFPLVNSSGENTMAVFTLSSTSMTTSSTTIPGTMFDLWVYNDIIFTGGNINTIYTYSVSTVVLVSTITKSNGISRILVDNIVANGIYITDYTDVSSQFNLALYDMASTTLAVLGSSGSYKATSRIGAMINLGTYNQLLIYLSGTTSFTILNKASMATLQSIALLPSGSKLSPYSLVSADMSGSEFRFGYVADSQNFIASSLKPSTTVCTTYSGSTCLACATDYYRHPATNQCYAIDEVPAGYGVVSGSSPGVLAVCSVNNCQVCTSNKDACQTCKSGYFKKSDDPSVCVQNNIPGYGIDSAKPTQITPCTTTYCQDCYSVYTSCIACKSGYSFKSDQPRSAGCFPIYTTTGYGPNLSNTLLINPCSVPNCAKCLSSYTQCSECSSGFALINGRTDYCHDITQPYSMFGSDSSRSSSPLTLYSCTDTHCDNCYSNINICTKCLASSGMMVMREFNNCHLNAIRGYGHDLTAPDYIDQCVIATCVDCTADRTVCIQMPQKGVMLLESTSFDEETATASVLFDTVIDDSKDFASLLTFSFYDPSATDQQNLEINSSIIVESITPLKNQQGIRLNLKFTRTVQNPLQNILQQILSKYNHYHSL